MGYKEESQKAKNTLSYNFPSETAKYFELQDRFVSDFDLKHDIDKADTTSSKLIAAFPHLVSIPTSIAKQLANIANPASGLSMAAYLTKYAVDYDSNANMKTILTAIGNDIDEMRKKIPPYSDINELENHVKRQKIEAMTSAAMANDKSISSLNFPLKLGDITDFISSTIDNTYSSTSLTQTFNEHVKNFKDSNDLTKIQDPYNYYKDLEKSLINLYKDIEGKIQESKMHSVTTQILNDKTKPTSPIQKKIIQPTISDKEFFDKIQNKTKKIDPDITEFDFFNEMESLRKNLTPHVNPSLTNSTTVLRNTKKPLLTPNRP